MGAEGERRGVTARGPGPKPAPRRTTPEFRPKQRRPPRPTPNSRRTNRPPKTSLNARRPPPSAAQRPVDVSSPANGQRQLAGVTVPSATDSPGTPQPPAIQRFAGYRSHRPAGHSTRGCAGGAYTEGLTP